MRVSHVITRLIVGGAQENTLSTVLGLKSKPEVEDELLSGPSEGAEGSLKAGIPDLVIIPDLVRPIHPWHDIRAFNELIRHFCEFRPRIVHTHSGKAGVLGRLAARRAGVPIIIHTIHGPSFGPFQSALANWVFCAAERVAGRVTTHFISVADAMTRQYLAAGIGRPEMYSRIFSGFFLTPFLTAKNDLGLRQKLGIGRDDFVVGTVARLFKLKGHDEILQMAPALLREYPQIKFLFVGGGPWRERLEEKIHSLGLENNFVFTGLVPPDEVHKYVGIMDILIHLSRREGLPRALPQAMAAGKPVVSYDCDGASEACIEGQTGFLVKVGDLDLLKKRIATFVDHAELRSRFGEQGRAFAREHFSESGMVDAIWALYQKLDASEAKKQMP